MKTWAAIFLSVILTGCATKDGLLTARQCEHQLDFAGGLCTATAVGPHTLLTAAHCIDGDTLKAVDGHPTRVLWVAEDGQDHALIGQTIGFPHWVGRVHPSVQGEPVFVLGNPGRLRNVYRQGYIAGQMYYEGHIFRLYQLPIFFGDSGSGVFNDAGQLVGVIAGVNLQTGPGAFLQLGLSRPLAFAASQWALIR